MTLQEMVESPEYPNRGALRDQRPYALGELCLTAVAGRCGSDVIRLEPKWPEVVAAVAGAGFQGIRVRNGMAVAGFEAKESALSLDEKTFTWRSGDEVLVSEVGGWRHAYLKLEPEDGFAPLVIYGKDGESLVEFLLGRTDLERLAAHLPVLEHPQQVPHTAPRSSRDPTTIHRSTVDERRLRACWQRPSDYVSIDRLVEAFRLDRPKLFEHLESKWASRLSPEAVCSLTNAAADLGLACHFEIASRTGRARLASDFRVQPRSGPAVVVEAGRGRLAFEPSRIDRVYSVRKPTSEGLASALEAFGPSGALQLRVRLAPDATSDERMMWRSCLPYGRVCAS